jgi:hypothetical protein
MIGLAGKGSLLRITSGWARVVRSHRELVKPTEPRLWLSSGDVVILIQPELNFVSFSCRVLTQHGEGWMHQSDLGCHQ